MAAFNVALPKFQDAHFTENVASPEACSDFFLTPRWISATWICGNNYRGTGFYGSYPPNYLSRMRLLFPEARKILHVCSGSLRSAELGSKIWPSPSPAMQDLVLHYTFDSDPALDPDFCGDAENLDQLVADRHTEGHALSMDWNVTGHPDRHRAGYDPYRSHFDLVLFDPPYSVEDAAHYGKPLLNKRRVLAEIHKVLKPGGTLALMDQSRPIHGAEWAWYGIISIYRSTNHRVRGVFLMEKR